MKTLRIVSSRMMNAATPVILGPPGRGGHVITGYYPRPSDGKRKPKLPQGRGVRRG